MLTTTPHGKEGGLIMGSNSKIEWTDHTFNPWRGCTKVSPGCANCYAETLAKRNPKLLGEWGPGKPRVLAADDMWKQPLKWNAHASSFLQCPSCGRRGQGADGCGSCGTELLPARPRVFCASLADWLDEEVPIEWLARLMELIMRTPHLDWLLLSKRPQNWDRLIIEALAQVENIKGDWPEGDPETQTGQMLNDWLGGNPPENVWIGTTVENQAEARKRIPALLKTPAKVRFLSCEPLLGPVDLDEWVDGISDDGSLKPLSGYVSGDGCYKPWQDNAHRIHWVITGGESGPRARPMNPDWARSLRDQCHAAGVPFFFKQWGAHYPHYKVGTGWFPATPFAREKIRAGEWLGDLSEFMLRVHKKEAGRLLDGVEHNDFPQLKRGGV